MRNAKKTLSLVMVAIFTTFIVLSGIPTSAAVKKTSKKTAKKVKVVTKKVVKKTAPAKKPAKPVATKPAVDTTMAAADKAVNKAEALTNGDTYDLVGNDTDLSNAQTAITNALEAVVKLNKDSSAYKGYMARIDAANKNVVDAMDQRDADAAAAADKAAQEAAVAAADKAVAAVEAAPLATAADLAAAKDLGTTAATAVAAVKDATKVADYTARLKAVADKGLALQAKLDKDAADAALAAAQALLPAKIVTVSAVDGTITVTFDKKPLTTVSAADFTVTKVVTTGSAVTSTVTPATVTVTSDTAVTITVPAIAQAATDQAVAYSVQYTTGTAVTAPAYTVAKAPAFAVVSVTALSMKQVQVVFNKNVDDSTLIDANFDIFAASAPTTDLATAAVYSLQADGKTVVVTLDGATKLDNNSTFEAVIGSVKDTDGNTVAAYDKTGISSVDITTPTVASAIVTGPKTIKVYFNEPVTGASLPGDFTVDGGNYYISTATASASGKSITLTLGAPLTTGTHTVAVANTTRDLVDYAGYPVINATQSITATPLTTAPTATILTQTQTKVVVKFSTPVNYVAVSTIYALYNNATYGIAPLGIAPDADGSTYTVNGVTYNDTWDLTFASLPAGQNTLYMTSNATTPIADAWGNTFATSVATLPLSIVADVTAPTVQSATIALDAAGTNHVLTVVFSEDVTGVNATNITVTDSDGNAVTMPLTSYTAATATALFTYAGKLNGGTYTVKVSTSVKDKSPAQNALAVAYAKAIAVTDVVKPTATASYIAAGKKIFVSYSEAVNTTLAATTANYQVNAGAVGITSITVVDTKNVVLNVDTALGAAPSLKIINVTDAAGNTISSSFGPYTIAAATADSGAAVVAVKALSTTQVSVEFDRVLTGFTTSGMSFVEVADGATLASAVGYIESVVTNSSNHSVITLHLATPLTADAKDATPSNVTLKITGAVTAVDSLGVPPTANTVDTTYAPATDTYDVMDKIVPTLVSAVATDNHTITLTFSEALKDATFAATLNGFSLSAGTLESVTHAAGTKVVVLHTTENDFVTGATVTYNSVAGITDGASNALASFSAATVAP